MLLLSLLESDSDSDSDEDIKHAFEEIMGLITQAMKDLDLPALTKLKMALVSPRRIIGVNVGTGHRGETDPQGDWRELIQADLGTDGLDLGMLLVEPMYLLMGRDFQDQGSYGFDTCSEEEATSVIFASEPLTEDADDWLALEFGEIVFLENDGENVTRTVNELKV